MENKESLKQEIGENQDHKVEQEEGSTNPLQVNQEPDQAQGEEQPAENADQA